MAKKLKQANQKKDNEKLTINNISVGMKIPDSTNNPQDWEITNDLVKQMRRYEQESNKSAIWRNKITGNFLYFKYVEEHPKFIKEKKKLEKNEIETEIKELEEKEVDVEENMLLDCIEDYKTKYGVKNVNINTKKFKTFYADWKEFGYQEK